MRRTLTTVALVLGVTAWAAPASDAGHPSAQVAISKMQFVPAELKVKAGTTVEWTNQDPVPHTVTATDHGWDSKFIAPDARWTKTFATPGRYTYFCSAHPSMKGTIVVE